jgi:hypothetical protein
MKAHLRPQSRTLIREARPTDSIQFLELRFETLQASPIALSAVYQENLSEPLKTCEDRLTMPAVEATIFLAERGRNLMGMTGIVRGGSPKTRHSA